MEFRYIGIFYCFSEHVGYSLKTMKLLNPMLMDTFENINDKSEAKDLHVCLINLICENLKLWNYENNSTLKICKENNFLG